jgi:hypothetical protein
LIIDGHWKETAIGIGIRVAYGGYQHDGITEAGDDGAAGLAGDFARFQNQIVGRDGIIERNGGCRMSPSAIASTAQTETRDEIAVAIHVLVLQVVEELAALADHLQQASTGVVIVDMSLEMIGQILNAGRQQRHLDLR